MIKKGKPKKVLILGSGALQIGQAGEFDYSGSQAIKALKEDGILTVLVDPNIATVQTSENYADKVYFVPVKTEFVERIIRRRTTGFNSSFFWRANGFKRRGRLLNKGVLEKNNVKVLGTPVDTIKDTEDRLIFSDRVNEVGLKVARSKTAISVEEAIKAAEEISFPVMVRIAYALGGSGFGNC